eukprot:PhM_4_TR5181/c3_g1_i1/m.99128/K18758/DIS3L2; DIS3-like exonuclease 2
MDSDTNNNNNNNANDRVNNYDFEDYWTQEQVIEGIRAGKVIFGEHSIIKWSKRVSFVRNKACFPHDVAITSLSHRNRAMHGDIVAVVLGNYADGSFTARQKEEAERDAKDPVADAPADEHHMPRLSEARTAHHNAVTLKPLGEGISGVLSASLLYKVMQQLKPAIPDSKNIDFASCGPQITGRIVHVFERAPKTLVCRALPNNNKTHAMFRFKAYDERYPYVMVPARQLPNNIREELEQFLLLVELQPDWEKKNHYPAAKFMQSLGYGRTVDTESKAILYANDVKDEPFTDAVEDCVVRNFVVPPVGAPLPPGRTDLRATEFVCTIDPATARDLDDALSICKLPNGHYRVGVHIADVSHFVPVGSELDREAFTRSTSCYLVERVIPMLPRRLSEDYCSLNAGSDKYAFSVLWELDHTGEIVPGTEWFGQSIIRNRCRLAYEQAQMMVEDDPAVDETMVVEDPAHIPIVKRCVKDLWKLASQIKKRRLEGGALTLGKSKLSFIFEDPDSRLAPVDFTLYRQKESNSLVEEFMLLANMRVAEKIYEFLPKTTLLRKHDRPKQKKFQNFIRSARVAGFTIDSSTKASLSESLRKMPQEIEDADAVLLLAVRSMQLAQYVPSYEAEEGPVSHYALNMELYTHFTSPIRRYPDLIVHRSLLLALEVERAVKAAGAEGIEGIDPQSLEHSRYFLEMNDLSTIADQANKKKEAARKSSDASLRLFLCLYLKAQYNLALHDPTRRKYYRTDAIVIAIDPKVLSITLLGVACETDIFHNNNDGKGPQRWKGANVFDKTNMCVKIRWSGDEPKQGDKMEVEGDDDDEEGEGGNVQTVKLLTRFTATLVVLDQSPMDFAAILHPPKYADKELPGLK